MMKGNAFSYDRMKRKYFRFTFFYTIILLLIMVVVVTPYEGLKWLRFSAFVALLFSGGSIKWVFRRICACPHCGSDLSRLVRQKEYEEMIPIACPYCANLFEAEDSFIMLTCPPYGKLHFAVDDGEALGDEWNSDKARCLGWLQKNWQAVWPVVHEKLNEMAEHYAYGETRLEPHITNAQNSLIIVPRDAELWGGSLEIEADGSGAFCIDMNRDQVVEYQSVY